MATLLPRQNASYCGLLFVFDNSNQRRRQCYGLLLQGHTRFLYRLPRYKRPLLTAAVLVGGIAASIVAGLSTLFGP